MFSSPFGSATSPAPFLPHQGAVFSLCLWLMPGAMPWNMDGRDHGTRHRWFSLARYARIDQLPARRVIKEEARSTIALTVPASWGASSTSRPIRYGLISPRFHKAQGIASAAPRPEGRREIRACHARFGILIYRHSIERRCAVASLRLLCVAPTRSSADQAM